MKILEIIELAPDFTYFKYLNYFNYLNRALLGRVAGHGWRRGGVRMGAWEGWGGGAVPLSPVGACTLF